MSTDQTDLSSFNTDQTLEEKSEQPEPDQFVRTWTPSATKEDYCLNCGGEVPADVGRVFGDGEGAVAACKNCVTNRNGGEFKTHSRVLLKLHGGAVDEF